MDCPSTGEFCGYLTHFSKVHGLADITNSVEHDSDPSTAYAEVLESLAEAMEIPEKSACDERYCAALSHAAVGSVIYTAFLKVRHKKQTEQG